MHSIPLRQLLHSTLHLAAFYPEAASIKENHAGSIEYYHNTQAQMETESDEHGVSSKDQGNLTAFAAWGMKHFRIIEFSLGLAGEYFSQLSHCLCFAQSFTLVCSVKNYCYSLSINCSDDVIMFYCCCIVIESIDLDIMNVKDFEVLHYSIMTILLYFFVSNLIQDFKRFDGRTVCSNLKQINERNSP
jgi:hypothetical protein